MVEIVREHVLTRDVSFESWMEHYAADHTEWVEGMVISLSPVTLKHNALSLFFVILLRHYLNRTRLGKLMTEPFVMKVKPGFPGREPDLHIVLNERLDIVKDSMTDGPADVVIEIVSQESRHRDLIEKYEEYEAGGVQEYWIINPLRNQSDFYVLGEDGLYKRIELKDGVFQSSVLRRFKLNTAVLRDEAVLENDDQIRALVDAMLEGEG